MEVRGSNPLCSTRFLDFISGNYFLSEKIDDLAKQGNRFFDNEDYGKSLDTWLKSLELIPSSQNCYVESVWFMTSIGDIHFVNENFKTSCEYLENAYTNISGKGAFNPFVIMRFGQCCLELGRKEKAAEYLLRAYMLDNDVFEYEDPKYIDFLKENGIL